MCRYRFGQMDSTPAANGSSTASKPAVWNGRIMNGEVGEVLVTEEQIHRRVHELGAVSYTHLTLPTILLV